MSKIYNKTSLLLEINSKLDKLLESNNSQAFIEQSIELSKPELLAEFDVDNINREIIQEQNKRIEKLKGLLKATYQDLYENQIFSAEAYQEVCEIVDSL